MTRSRRLEPHEHATPARRQAYWGEQGLLSFNAGCFDKAITQWLALPQDDPWAKEALAEAHFRLALAQVLPAGQDKQIAALRQAVELDGTDLRYRYHLGLALHRANYLEEAMAEYSSVLQHDPAWPGAALVLALALLEYNPNADISTLPGYSPQVQKVLAVVQTLRRDPAALVAHVPDGPLGQLWHGLALLQVGDPRARAVLEGIKKLPGQQAPAVRLYYAGVAAAQAGDLGATCAYWDQAYERKFRSSRLLTNLDVALHQEISTRLAAGDVVAAATLAYSMLKVPRHQTGLNELLVLALDRGAHAVAIEGNWACAAEWWEAARQLVSASAKLGSPRPFLHNLALAYEAQEQWAQAAEAWRAMLRTRPRKKAADEGLSEAQWAWVRKRVIECYKWAGLPGEAVTLFRQSLKTNPNDLEIRMQLADALLANQQEQAAQNELLRIIAIEPHHIEANLRIAAMSASYGAWYQAKQALRQVLSRHPDHPDAKRQMARLLLAEGMERHHQGQFEQATRLFTQGQTLAPTDYQFPLNLARIAIDQHKFDQAQQLLERTLELAADNADAYLQVIACWIVANQIAAARAVLDRAEANLQLSSEFYIDLGVVMLTRTSQFSGGHPLIARSSKMPDAEWSALAQEMLERAIALQPNDPYVAARIAAELMSIRPDLALRYIEPAAAQLADDPHMLMLLGLAQALNKQPDEARKTLRRAGRLAKQRGNMALVQEIEQLRSQIDSPFLHWALQSQPLYIDFDEDDKDAFW